MGTGSEAQLRGGRASPWRLGYRAKRPAAAQTGAHSGTSLRQGAHLRLAGDMGLRRRRYPRRRTPLAPVLRE